MNKKFLALFAMLMVIGLPMAGCFESEDDDDDDDDNGPKIEITVNGQTLDVTQLFSSNPAMTVDVPGDSTYTGISLSAIINSTGLANQDTWQFIITADDDYSKDVTWVDLQNGVLVLDGLMVAFSTLPKRYSIRGVASIEPVHVDTITVNGWEYTLSQPFDKLPYTNTTLENVTYEGVWLSDLINDTGVASPADNNYTLTASDGYNKTVSWADVLTAVLHEAEMRAVFPELAKSFWVSDLVTIEVVD